MYIKLKESGVSEMSPEVVLFGLAVSAPLICHFVTRNAALRMGLAAPLAVGFMSLCIFVGESRLPLPDYDIVFGVSLVVWNMLAFTYAVVMSLVLSAIARWFGQPRDPESSGRYEG